MKKTKTAETLYEGREIELLSPAGSYEGFEAALGAGADAVYAGGKFFGARAGAVNFQEEELIRAIRVSHIHGKKFYLTVNTLLKDQELEEQLYQWMLPFYKAGLDAVIVQDPGVLRFVRQRFPGLDIHASTQMTVTGPRGMKFLEEQGVTRVVPARELSLSEIMALHRACPVEIETFIHGALCYSFSGQCLMSSLFGGRSGNRGRCAQPCRLPYQTRTEGRSFSVGKKGPSDGREYPLSMKDLCTIELLPEILAAGVTSLKIEGRMKSPAYTAGVTAVYRKYLDLLLREGPQAYQTAQKDKRQLLEVFSRGGSCTGYYQKHNGPEMIAFVNDKKTGDISVNIRKRKEKINGRFILFSGRPAILEVSCRGKTVSVSGGEVQKAQSQPLTEDRIRLQMDRLGNTEFAWDRLEIRMEEGIFLPVKLLNDLRREALEKLEELLAGPGREEADRPEAAGRGQETCRKETAGPCRSLGDGGKRDSLPRQAALPIYVSCETAAQAGAAERVKGIRGMYLPFDVMESFMERGRQKERELYLALPHMDRGEAPDEFWGKAAQWLGLGMKGFLVRTLESYAALRSRGLGRFCVLDASCYAWNKEAGAFWQEAGILRDTVPYELNEKEISLRDNRGSELVIYGYLPLMITAQCLKKNIGGCDKKEGAAWLKDRYNKEFPSVCCCRPWKKETTGTRGKCYNIVYNSVPFGLLKEHEQVKALGVSSLRLSFTLESPVHTEKILREFLQAYLPDPGDAAEILPADGNGSGCGGMELTRGHFKRGVK